MTSDRIIMHLIYNEFIISPFTMYFVTSIYAIASNDESVLFHPNCSSSRVHMSLVFLFPFART